MSKSITVNLCGIMYRVQRPEPWTVVFTEDCPVGGRPRRFMLYRTMHALWKVQQAEGWGDPTCAHIQAAYAWCKARIGGDHDAEPKTQRYASIATLKCPSPKPNRAPNAGLIHSAKFASVTSITTASLMTRPTDQESIDMDVEKIPTETEMLTHAERERIEQETGFIVAKIHGCGDFEHATGYVSEESACMWAKTFAAAKPGGRYGVFKLAREFTGYGHQDETQGKDAVDAEPPTEG